MFDVAPFLVHPDWEKPFKLQTDASDYAIATILDQVSDDACTEKVVCYASRHLTDAKKRSTRLKRSCLPSPGDAKNFRKYLSGQRFTVETDHANLRWLMSGKHQTGRLARWVLRLQGFDFVITHKPGKSNGNAGALSRLPTVASDSSTVPLLAVTENLIELPGINQLREQQESDPLLSEFIGYLKSREQRAQQDIRHELRETLRDTGTISVDKNTGLLMQKSILNGRRHYVSILPSASRSAVMKAAHDLPMSGHLGCKKTYHRVRSQYYWKGPGQDVKDFVRSCMECQLYLANSVNP